MDFANWGGEGGGGEREREIGGNKKLEKMDLKYLN